MKLTESTWPPLNKCRLAVVRTGVLNRTNVYTTSAPPEMLAYAKAEGRGISRKRDGFFTGGVSCTAPTPHTQTPQGVRGLGAARAHAVDRTAAH